MTKKKEQGAGGENKEFKRLKSNKQRRRGYMHKNRNVGKQNKDTTFFFLNRIE